MTTSTRPQPDPLLVSLGDDPGQLIAIIPPLLGFRPDHSVVLVGHLRGRRNLLGQVARIDLPEPEHYHAVAERLGDVLRVRDHSGASVVIVGDGETGFPSGTGPPPYGELVAEVLTELGARSVERTHAFWVPAIRSGAPWRCYESPDCSGAVPDLESGVVAAAAVRAGLVTRSSREACEAQLDPVAEPVIARRSALLDQQADDASEPMSEQEIAWAVRRRMLDVRDALVRARRGELELSDEDVVRLAVALGHSAVRDACLALAVPPESPVAMAAGSLWLALVKETPAPERAQAATLLAYTLYVRGEGPFAQMAVDKACEADPGCVLAGLLSQAFQVGMPPGRLRYLGVPHEALELPPEDDR